MNTLVWFRSDLRVHDNPALHHGLNREEEGEDSVNALYIICDEYIKTHPVGPRKLWFTRQALLNLQESLAEAAIKLDIIRVKKSADIAQALLKHCLDHKIDQVNCNAEYPWDELQRDRGARDLCEEHQITFKRYHDRCLIPPGALTTKQGDPYRVFTPFSKAWRQLIDQTSLTVYPKPSRKQALQWDSEAIVNKFSGLPLSEMDDDHWAPSEQRALAQLGNFCKVGIEDYHELRDFPAEPGTSCLSPYLSLGLLSPKQCFIAAANSVSGHWTQSPGVSTWLNELIWREFYMHVAVAFPQVCKHKPMQTYTDKVPWRKDTKVFDAWCEGKTGVPIVDAAMRQLNNTGWMHNRLRMITAMFLSKNLAIDWRWGEQYFMEQLVDGEFCANNGGWQWSASTGTDAAPYFRIMNPITQAERFDPKGEFIRRYVPELADLTGKKIYSGEGAKGYRKPIVDVKLSRKQAIERFASVNKQESAQ